MNTLKMGRGMKLRSSVSLIIILGLSLALVTINGCSREPGEGEAEKKAAKVDLSPAYGGRLVEGSIGDASTLLTPLATDSASFGVAAFIYNGLLKFDKDLKLVGDLAESWEVGNDGLTITFHLRKGVKWHDGVELTSKDVMFSYQVMIDPKTPTAYSGDYLMVKKAEAPDKYTFRVHYAKPFAPALISWTLNILPAHLLQGKDITESPLARHPIGTGPYRFVSWKQGDRIILTYNPDYFEGRAYMGKYIFRVIPDQATMFLELKAGGVDMMGLTPLQYNRQTDNAKFKRGYRKYRYLASSYTYLGYNLLDPKFKDKRVRRALSYAIDKQEIIDGALLGLGTIATGPYKPGTWAYNSNVKRYPYDPAKAKQLLGQAGWTDSDGDGILDRNGQPFKFTIITNQGNSLRAKTAQIIQRRLREIGIVVDIRPIEWAAFINEFIDKKKFEAVILGWTIGQDPDQYDIWHSSKTGIKELNFISYKNSELDELLIKARETFDLEARKRYYYRFQEILAEDQPYTFLYVPEALPVVHARVQGIEPAPAGISYNFIKWYVPKGLQRTS